MEKKIIIVDTDVGADCDDMLALAYLIGAEKENKISLAAIAYSNAVEDAPSAIVNLFHSFGEEAPPIGAPVYCGSAFDSYCGKMHAYDNYCKQIAEKFGSCGSFSENSAVRLMRRILAENERVTIDKDGRTFFSADKDGRFRILKLKGDNGENTNELKARAAQYIDSCIMRLYTYKNL